MRGFRSAKEGLRDPRTAYTFLVVVSIALFIMGGVSRRLTKNLDAERLASERRALTLCADSLDGYLTAEDDNGGSRERSDSVTPRRRSTARTE